MTIEFDPKCGFAQQEDKLASLLIPRTVGGASEVVTTETSVTPMIGISLEDLYTDFRHFGLQTPAGLVLVPGETTLQCMHTGMHKLVCTGHAVLNLCTSMVNLI